VVELAASRRLPFRVAFVAGVTPDKWLRTWAERLPREPLESFPVQEWEQVTVLHDGRAEMAFVRLPVERALLHVIPLYHEVPVVVFPRDHALGAYDEVRVADLADEHLLQVVPPMVTREVVELVAAGAGVLVLPLSVARMHHRRDVEHRPVTDVPPTEVGLAWRTDTEDDRVETFIGIVRGRTPRSSRSR